MFRARRLRSRKPALRPLLACPDCDADALCPLEWTTFGDRHWLMWMRCGECGGALQMLVDNLTAAAIDLAMDRQQAAMAAQADALSLEQMEAEVEAFVGALEQDLVDASDFAR
jgi:hypothetical protein